MRTSIVPKINSLNSVESMQILSKMIMEVVQIVRILSDVNKVINHASFGKADFESFEAR